MPPGGASWAQPPAGGAPWAQPAPARPPGAAPIPAPAGWGPPPTGAGGPPDAKSGSPWLVALTIGLAALVLGLVVLGLRAAAGPSPSSETVEVPSRPGTPSTSAPRSSSPSTTGPSSSPSSTVPPTGTGGSAVPTGPVDTATPRVQVSDLDGRFEVTVPRTWLNLPTPLPDQNQWVPFVQRSNGEVVSSELSFVVRWAASDGCALDRCAAEVVARMKANLPNVTPVTAPDTVGGLPAVRIEANTANERLVAWVVVQGDRYWVPQLRGLPDDFDEVLAVVRTIVASMSFP